MRAVEISAKLSLVRDFFLRRRRLATALFAAAGPLLVIAGAELAARAIGVQASYIGALAPIRDLKLLGSFSTDGEGIFRANPQWDGWEFELNSDGFRGPELDPPGDGLPTVLFVGDSFTWGIGAGPIERCFVDRVGRAGYRAVNLSVPGTAPNQYEALVRKYIARIQPDVVIVLLYLGNDFTSAAPMIPNHDLVYVTNAGWLWGYEHSGPDAKPISLEQAYKRSYGEAPRNYLLSYARYQLSGTVLGSRLVNLAKAGYNKANDDSGDHSEQDNSEQLYPVVSHLDGIVQLSRSVGARAEVLIIPYSPKLKSNVDFDECIRMVSDFRPHLAPNMKAEHYHNPPDDHFNNDGHAAYADYILGKLRDWGYEAADAVR